MKITLSDISLYPLIRLTIVFIALTGVLSSAVASGIADDIRASQAGPESKNGGFLEIGVTANFQRRINAVLDQENKDDMQLSIGLSISAGYRYERLFIEASDGSLEGLNMGVTLHESDQWSADLLLANIAGGIAITSDDPVTPTTENERSRAILGRDSLAIAAGARVTGFFGDNIIQMRLVSDWYGGQGVFGSARIGRQWQLGNWNARAIAGLRYNSERFNNYIYGVSTEEQSERFGAYKAGDAWIPEFELGASLPVREDWVYSARLRVRAYPNSIVDSPLVTDNSDFILSTGIHYVF